MNIDRIASLIKKEFTIEFRQRTSMGGVILYLIGCVYLCYLAVQKINSAPIWKMREKLEWNALLWILLFFNAILTVSRSFSSENKGRSVYSFSIYNPSDFISSKLIYNMILVLLVSFLGYFFFAIFVGNPVNNQILFLFNLVLSASAFSGILTLTSGIASKTTGGFMLMSILSIPLLFPVLLLAMRISLLATIGSDFTECLNYLLGLLILNIIIVSLCLMLFPYLWRE